MANKKKRELIRNYKATKKNPHQNNSGKFSDKRGKPPHKGGYHAANGDDKKVRPKTDSFKKVIIINGRMEEVPANCPWKPGK